MFRSFELHRHYWKCLIEFICPVDIGIVQLTSSTHFADLHIVSSQVLYPTVVGLPQRMDDRSHGFHLMKS